MARTIRIFVDRSKDSSGGGHFVGRPAQVPGEPDIAFHATDNRLPLQAGTLQDYDLLVICGQSLKPYAAEELAVIEGFVADGGGLLLAADAALFELEANAPVETMAQNQVAALFGGQFLSGDCSGAKAHGSLLIHPPYAQVQALPDPCAAGHHAEIVNARMGLGPISPPRGARPFIRLKGSGLPVAAAGRYGQGRVVMVGSAAFASDEPAALACIALTRYLAGRRGTRGTVDLPRYLGDTGKVERGTYFHLSAEGTVSDRIAAAAEVVAAAERVVKNVLGQDFKPGRTLSLADTLAPARQVWHPRLAMQAPPGTLARRALLALSTSQDSWQYLRLLSALGTARAWEIELACRLLPEMGHADEAERCRARADRWVNEMGRRDRTFDLARNYAATQQETPRGLVVTREFLDRYGAKVLGALRQVVTRPDAFKDLPETYAWESDRAIHALSLAVGKDLFPWFRERGLSVHPLPIVQPGSRSRKRRMMARLNEALRDSGEELSSRLEAATDLVAMGKSEQDWVASPAGRPDVWTRLCEAMKLSRQGDGRAVSRLRGLFTPGRSEAVRALAGLALADLGEAGVADGLIPLARRFEPRFQLAVGYALEKAGAARAHELSLLEVTDEHGQRVGRMDISYDGRTVAMHGEVEGYRVNNIFCLPGIRRFTSEAALSEYYVAWVHTSAQWRRRGLSRQTMETTMRHPAGLRHAALGLGTGTRNVAHRLYRDYGLTDMATWDSWFHELAASSAPLIPTGVVLREYEARDDGAAAKLVNEVLGRTVAGTAWYAPGPTVSAFVAWREEKLVGLAAADYPGDEQAQLWLLAVDKDDQQAAIADALLALVHGRVQGQGAKRVAVFNTVELEYLREALQRAGYVHRPGGGVWLMGVRDLVQFLGEIAPALERRLARSEYKGWEGTIDLLGTRQRARLAVRAGQVTARRPVAAAADVTMTCDDDTAARVALGRETPFEAHLQARLDIAPRLSPDLVNLLETLFPKVPVG